MIRLHGKGVSSGRATGPLFVVVEPAGRGRGDQLGSIEQIAEVAAAQLEALAAQRRLGAATGADVLEVHAMMLRDPGLIASIGEQLKADGSPEAAITAGIEKYAQMMEQLSDEYLRERAADVREVGRLMLAVLNGGAFSRLQGLSQPAVVVAHELAPVDTLSVEPQLMLGLVTEVGGRTSHAAIVARELGIPAVVGVPGVLDLASGAKAATIDGDSGEVVLLASSSEAAQQAATTPSKLPELDFVELMGNAGSLAAVNSAVLKGARGVGLFRTEFLFLGRDTPVSEEDQLLTYEAACAACPEDRVVVRTLDIGSDKQPSYLPSPHHEPNPALGQRGIRLWLSHEELWRPQVRALVAAGRRWKNLNVMLPMVAAREEMVHARRLFEQEAERQATEAPRLGMMVELPAVAASLEAFSGLVDFVSLGTNDLTQYAVGADRELDWDPHLGEFNPGVLRLLAGAIRGAGRINVGAGVCGEMAGSPEGAVFLVGVGATSLSMSAGSLPRVAQALAALGLKGCEKLALEALDAQDADSARAALSTVASLER